MSKNNHTFESFFIGAIIGFVAGILFAPQSGEKTRDQIRKIAEENEELIGDTRSKTESLIAQTMSSIDKGFEKLSSMIDERNGEHSDTKNENKG